MDINFEHGSRNSTEVESKSMYETPFLWNRGPIVAATTFSKTSLHSNFGAYQTVISSVALVIKCCFKSFHMFQVFLIIPKCRRIFRTPLVHFLVILYLFVVKRHFWSQSHKLCLLSLESVCRLAF